MTSRSEVRLQRRIDDQRTSVANLLHSPQVPAIDDFYWGTSRPAVYGSAATPSSGNSILSQLLLTPALIVDILPLPPRRFVETYGADPAQLAALAEEGFIIPNIYHYKRGGWRDYLQYPQIVDLLASYGRPNAEWITSYLDKAYGFQEVERKYTEFFDTVCLSSAERGAVLAACHGRVNAWDRFAPTYGQRLAYIDVLGGEHFREVVEWICSEYLRPEGRANAVRVLNASKHLVATSTTAAYGGVPTFVPENLRDITASLPLVREVATGRPAQPPSAVPRAAYQFVEELAARARGVRLPSFGASGAHPTAPLKKSQFKKYGEVLRSVGDGRLGNVVSDMTMVLSRQSETTTLVIDEYRQLAKGLDAGLQSLSPVAAGISRLGSFLIKVDDVGPPDDGLVSWWFVIGNQLKLVAAALHQREVIPLFNRHAPRRVYGRWRTVRASLGLNQRKDE